MNYPVATALVFAVVLTASPARAQWKPADGPLMTRWAKDVRPEKVHPEYPRPQMVREEWLNLNGLWQLAFATEGEAAPTGKDLPENACDTIPARRSIGPACVIDVTAEVETDPDFLLTRERLLAWEEEHGRIPKNAWVLLRTGWSKRTDPAKFLNVKEDGPHAPGFHKDCSHFLAYDRDVLGVGVESVGTDAGQAGTFDPPFPNHTTMHGAGKFGLASLCNLDQLPPTGAMVIASPLKIVDGSGSPLRVLALAPA